MNTYKEYVSEITGLPKNHLFSIKKEKNQVTMKIRKINDARLVTNTIKALGNAQVSFNAERNYTLFEWKFNQRINKHRTSCKVMIAVRGNRGAIRLQQEKVN